MTVEWDPGSKRSRIPIHGAANGIAAADDGGGGSHAGNARGTRGMDAGRRLGC